MPQGYHTTGATTRFVQPAKTYPWRRNKEMPKGAMFAPPPVQLSRAEIEARINARRKSSIAAGPLSKTRSASSSESQERSRSLQDLTSPTSPRPSRSSAEDRNIKDSSPIKSPRQRQGSQPGSSLPAWTPETFTPHGILQGNFAERPRKAPVPPKRSTAPPEGWFERARVAAHPPPQSPVPETPAQSPSPVVPVKSPKRKKIRPPSEILRSLQEDPFNAPSTYGESSPVKRKGKDMLTSEEDVQPIPVARANTAPAAMSKGSATSPKDGKKLSASTKPGVNTEGKKVSGVRGSRIDKAAKRTSAEFSIRGTPFDLDELYSFASLKSPPRKSSEDKNSTRSASVPDIQLPWRRPKRGETMSMLVESGFFAVAGLTGPARTITISPPLALLTKDLPPTPTSIGSTPAELYPRGATKPARTTVRNRKPANRKRSPLAQVSTASSEVNGLPSDAKRSALSPGRLSAIPENTASSENTPPPSGISTPVLATQIHLRGGSVVTVCPPEMTAWQRSIYIQGPIKLPKPVIVPRKDSVASLEAFQDAIDQVYQEALSIPRRRSDEQAVDDVCEFFDDYGFDEIGFIGDDLWGDESQAGAGQVDDQKSDDIERFSTPPTEPKATPLEKVVAQEVVELLSKPLPSPTRDDQESLRARGIARLSQKAVARHDRKDSVTIDKPGPVHFLPVQAESLKEAVPEAFRTDHQIAIKAFAVLNVTGEVGGA